MEGINREDLERCVTRGEARISPSKSLPRHSHSPSSPDRRLMFFEQAREQAEREFKANNKDAMVRCRRRRPAAAAAHADCPQLLLSLCFVQGHQCCASAVAQRPACLPCHSLLTVDLLLSRLSMCRPSPSGAARCWSWPTSARHVNVQETCLLITQLGRGPACCHGRAAAARPYRVGCLLQRRRSAACLAAGV